jgi:hypothetical protein
MLKMLAIWLLLMHFIDLHWVVMPTIHHHGLHFSWIDIVTFLGIGGVFCWFFWVRFSSRRLIPIGDPGLDKTLEITQNQG